MYALLPLSECFHPECHGFGRLLRLPHFLPTEGGRQVGTFVIAAMLPECIKWLKICRAGRVIGWALNRTKA